MKLFLTLILFSSSFFILQGAENIKGKKCSPLNQCFGKKFIWNGESWTEKVGKTISIPEGKEFCAGAFSPNPGVIFSDNIIFILHVETLKNNTFFKIKEEESHSVSYIVEGAFYNQLNPEISVLPKVYTTVTAEFLAASMKLEKQRYVTYCNIRQ